MRALRIFLSELFDRLIFAAAVICALCALVAQFGREYREWDVFAHFAPLWLAGGLTALILGLVFKGAARGLIVAAALVGIGASAALMAPEYLRDTGPKAPANAPEQLKVVQFNVWRANTDVPGSVDWVVRENPDIVVIEEDNAELRALLARRTGWNVSCMRCGVTIFSRAKPVAEGSARGGAPLTWATFRDRRGPFTIVGVHEAWPTDGEDQRRQEARLARTLARLPRTRTLAVGDFNSAPWSFQRRAWDVAFGLVRRDRALFSWPAAQYRHMHLLGLFPFLPIDHVYAGSDWATVSVRRGPRLGSDHYPVIMTLAPVSPR